MMGSNSSNVKTINVESAKADDESANNNKYYFDSSGQKRKDDPVAYRDKDGNIQFYGKDEEPTVWVPEEQASKPNDIESAKGLTVDNHDDKDGARVNDKTIVGNTSKIVVPVSDIVLVQTENQSNEDLQHKSETDKREKAYTDVNINEITKSKTREGFVSPHSSDKGEEDDHSKETILSPEEPTKKKTTSVEYTLFRDGTFVKGSVASKSTDGPKFKPPSISRRDLIPDEDMFDFIDEHVFKTPAVAKKSIDSLVRYLTEPASTPLDEVRAFYVWITHNINYDTSGYFGRSNLLPTDPGSVLENRTAVCEGYARLFEAFCKEVAIPTKIIKGYVKGYGYKPGDDVTKDKHNAHMWNAVYIESNWFLIDVTLGAGYVKSKEKSYVAKFNPIYFMSDPRCFITDHFPYLKGDIMNETNQLLDNPITFEEFFEMLNMEKCGKEWGIEPVTHTTAVIKDVKYELDIQLQQTYTPMSDYLAFLYRDGKKLDQFTYTNKIDLRTVNIHAIMPHEGELALIVYGRRKQDSPQSNLEPLVRYILTCKAAFDNPTPYPTHHTLYGLVDDPELYSLKDVSNVYNEAVNGEATIRLKPSEYSTSDFTDLLPRLFYGDHNAELKTQIFIEYSEDFQSLVLRARLPYIGYFKLVLFGNSTQTNKLKPFMTYLIENRKVVNKEGFPVAHAHALKYKCHLVEPLRKGLASGQNYLVLVNVKSQVLVKVKAHETVVPKTDDDTFEGLVSAPKYDDSEFVIYGSDKEGDIYHPLYTCKMVAGNILSVPSAISLPTEEVSVSSQSG